MSARIEQIAKGSPDAAQFIERELSNLGAQYVVKSDGFIARLMAPAVPVQEQGGKFWEYSKADFRRNEMQVRGDGDAAALGGYGRTEKTYWTEVYALAKKVGPREMANNPRADQSAVRYLSGKSLLHGEGLFGSQCWGTGKWTTEKTGHATPTGSQILTWRSSSAKPIEQLTATIKETNKISGGFKVNRLAFGANAWDVFRNHANVLAYINGGATAVNPSIVTRQLVAQILEVEQVLVADATHTTSAPNASTSTFDYILDGDGVLGLHATDGPSLDEPSAAYHFDWTGYLGASSVGLAIFEEPIPLSGGAKLYTVEHALETKKIAADLGFWLQDILVAAS